MFWREAGAAVSGGIKPPSVSPVLRKGREKKARVSFCGLPEFWIPAACLGAVVLSAERKTNRGGAYAKKPGNTAMALWKICFPKGGRCVPYIPRWKERGGPVW